MGLFIPITGLILAVLAPILYSRADLLFLFYANAPARLPEINVFRADVTLHADVVRYCEDGILVQPGEVAVTDEGEGFVLLSCDPGRESWNTVMGVMEDAAAPDTTGIYYLAHHSDDTAAMAARPEKLQLLDFHANASEFHPLGIDYHAPSKRLFVLNLAASGPKVEIFQLYPTDRAATHLATLTDPLIRSPNSIAAISADELFITNDHFIPSRWSKLLSMIETNTAFHTGSVVQVKLDASGTAVKQAKTLARMPFANGIVPLNETTLAVAALTQPSIEIFEITRPDKDEVVLKHRERVRMPFLPDNLRLDGNGKLLIAGHPFPPAVDKIAASRMICRDVERDREDERCKVDRLSWVAEWTEEKGVRTLYVTKKGYGTSTTAMRDARTGVGYVTGLYGEGVLRFRE